MKQNHSHKRSEARPPAVAANEDLGPGGDALVMPAIPAGTAKRAAEPRPNRAGGSVIVRELRSAEENVRTLDIGSESELKKAPSDPLARPAEGALRWIDISAPSSAILEKVTANFGLDKQEVEDCMRVDDTTKLDRYGEHFFIADTLFQGMGGKRNLECSAKEMHFILGDGYLITVHEGGMPIADALWSRVVKNHAGPEGARSSGDLYVLLMNDVLREQRKALEAVGHDALRLNNQLHQSRLSAQDSDEVSAISASLINIQSRISRTLETLQALRDEEDTVIDSEFRGGLFGRVVSHHQSLLKECRFQRELIKEVREHNDAMTIQHTNQITRRFAACSALTLPTVVYGAFFGSNFEAIPYNSEPSLWGAVGATVALTGAIALYLRKNGWFR